MRILVIYDDTGKKSETISDIIGNKGFADVVVKKRHIEEYYKEGIEKLFPDVIWRRVHSLFEYPELVRQLDVYCDQDVRVLHCFSNYFISDFESAKLSFEKLKFIDEIYGVLDSSRAVAAMFPNVNTYISFCKNIISGEKAWDLTREIKDHFNIKGMIDIGIISNFVQCITGDFAPRYFNDLKGNEYTIVKSSSNKRKIKAEYDFYNLLPDDMKYWFVMPFDYRDNGETASYTMERLHMTDLAIKWVHGSMGATEFEALMNKYFYFLMSRHSKSCTKNEYRVMAEELYEKKVMSRIDTLKRLPMYNKIQSFLLIDDNISVDNLVERYLRLKKKIENSNEYPYKKVIGHGDPCFANALYNKSTQTLKFIDPKGASTEEELWTNPYYDLAKLSHSVCGKYDYFNNGLFDIRVSENLTFELDVPFDGLEYIEIFKKKVVENGFDYWTVRIYEASLFISMLPLHMDNPHKVLGFILNVDGILKEIEENV